ncbi:PAS domain-containing protein [Ferrovibrio sp.]|uniref:PAS domain-containing protein n=1 Tax=Ferrovibrio sp. TaxID=1917215 RepID=UPI001B72C1D0|nr:PAS domain-containing protein [Ferrovibrio sp.]MBP7063783.1 PAS domain-containing protein [Ferrovibrio sp.]
MTSPTSIPASPLPLPDMAAFAHVKDGLLRDLLAYYLARRDGARVPLRSRIAPMDFPKLLSNVFLYE